MNIRNYILTLIVGLGLPFVLQAQFNMSVNYAIGYANVPNYNAIIDNYNTTQTGAKFRLDNIGLLNGIGLGIRYRFGFAGLEFTWTERFKRSKAEGENLEGLYEFREIGYRYRTFGVGYTTFISDNLSFGGSFNQDKFVVNTETDKTLDQGFMDESMYSSRFFIGISTEISNAMELSLQPFVWVPWGSFDFMELNNLLNPNLPLDNATEDFFHFGISIIFYNGQQY